MVSKAATGGAIAVSAAAAAGLALFLNERSKDKPPSSENLVVTISANPISGKPPLTVDFNAIIEGGVDPFQISWDFGDGNSTIGQKVTHTYQNKGEFIAKATVLDSQGLTKIKTIKIIVESETLPPPQDEPIIKSFNVTKTSGFAPLSVGFDIDISDPRSQVVWDFGDGSEQVFNNLSPSHTYFEPGTFNGNVTVTNSENQTQTQSFSILVQEVEIIPDLITGFDPPSSTGTAGITNFSSSISLGVSLSEASIVWDWGDGTKQFNVLQADHIYDKEGNFEGSVTVTVGSETETRTFTISTQSTFQEPQGEIQLVSKDEAAYTLFANFQGETPLTFNWDFGDGNVGQGQQVTHVYSAPGNYTVKVVVRDPNNRTGEDTVTVPVFEDDVAIKFGDANVSIFESSSTDFDYDIDLINNTDRFIDGQLLIRLFDSNGSMVDISDRSVSLSANETKQRTYNLPTNLAAGFYQLTVEYNVKSTGKLIDDDIIGVNVEEQESEDIPTFGTIRVTFFGLLQKDETTVEALVQYTNDNSFPVSGTAELFPEFINPDGSIVNLEDQIKALSIGANETTTVVFTWMPLDGFPLGDPEGSKLRVQANYRNSEGNLIAQSLTEQIDLF